MGWKLQVYTDYVFEGTASEPYEESAETIFTVYGKSKLAGEQEALAIGGRTFIVRTSWVFGKHGRNFVETIRELAQTRDEIRVVMDQLVLSDLYVGFGGIPDPSL